MPNYIILNKSNQSIYTGSVLNVLANPEEYYIICTSKKTYNSHTKSSLAKLKIRSKLHNQFV